MTNEFTKIHGVKLLNKYDVIVKSNEKGEDFEPETMDFWNEITQSRPNTIALDIGSYTGIYAIKAALNGLVSHAFEPSIASYERILENSKLNNVEVHAHNIALSNCGAGKIKFLEKDKSNTIMSSANQVGTELDGFTSVEVDVDNLDSVLDDEIFKKVSIIKIDVEGHEFDVLYGSRKFLEECDPIIIVECLLSTSLYFVRQLLESYGYEVEYCFDDTNFVFVKP